MKDVLVTIIIFWVLWRIFGGKTVVHKYTFNQHTGERPAPESRPEGEIKVEKEPGKKSGRLRDEAGEYIDYEEVK